jgi:hypothetical protein
MAAPSLLLLAVVFALEVIAPSTAAGLAAVFFER